MCCGLTAMPVLQLECTDLPPTVCFLEEISHTLFNRLSFTNVSFIEENPDQKLSQELVLVNTVLQSNDLKSYTSSSEISCIKYYCLSHHSY